MRRWGSGPSSRGLERTLWPPRFTHLAKGAGEGANGAREGGECGRSPRSLMWLVAGPVQNREEEEDGVSHRKPGGWILPQLNH